MTGTSTAAPARLREKRWLKDPALQAALMALEKAGGTARVAGGAVRNALLGYPINDVDIATDLEPQAVCSALAKAGIHPVPTGIEHGTITAVVSTGGTKSAFEVTTLRVDVETHGRRATVAFTDDWAVDAGRRDFTMNALYCDRSGALFDPLGGYADAIAGRVVFVGDAGARIEEDYLRILRFFRIHATYGKGVLDEAGLAACLARMGGLDILSAERVRQEVWKLLVARGALDVLAEMNRDGVLAQVLRVAPDFLRFERLAEFEVAAKRPADPLLRFAALAVRPGDDAAALRRRFVLTNAETRRLEVLAHQREAVAVTASAVALRRLIYAHGVGGFGDMVLFDLSASQSAKARDAAVRALQLAGEWAVPTLPLAGRDIIDAGVDRGPMVGRILKQLEADWIGSDFQLSAEQLRVHLDKIIDS
jgi:poly(A) polymerase